MREAALCPTCDEPLHLVTVGHQWRCARRYADRRRRTVLAVLALAVLTLALFAFPAHAQTFDPGLTDSFNTKALATIAAVELIAIGYLFVRLMQTQDARLADLAKANEATQRIQETAIRLSLQALEAVEVVEELVDRTTKG